jgi:chromosome segregation ATPase
MVFIGQWLQPGPRLNQEGTAGVAGARCNQWGYHGMNGVLSVRVGRGFGGVVAAAAIGAALLAGGCDDAEKSQLRKDNAGLQDQNRKLADDLAAARSGKDGADADSKSWMGKLADATGRAEALLAQVEAAKALADKATGQYDEAVKKLAAAEALATQFKTNLDKSVADAAKAAETAKAQLAALKTQVTNITTKYTDAQKLADAARAETEALRVQVAELTKKVADLTQALKDGQGLRDLLGPGEPPK